jgi:hypothetical protein
MCLLLTANMREQSAEKPLSFVTILSCEGEWSVVWPGAEGLERRWVRHCELSYWRCHYAETSFGMRTRL